MEWISQFKHGDPDNKEYQRQIIDIFLNSIYVFDDRLVFTYNYKNGTQTVTMADIFAAFGSDLKSRTPPRLRCAMRAPQVFLFFCSFTPALAAGIFLRGRKAFGGLPDFQGLPAAWRASFRPRPSPA